MLMKNCIKAKMLIDLIQKMDLILKSRFSIPVISIHSSNLLSAYTMIRGHRYAPLYDALRMNLRKPPDEDIDLRERMA